jgi:hypothetical protein
MNFGSVERFAMLGGAHRARIAYLVDHPHIGVRAQELAGEVAARAFMRQ